MSGNIRKCERKQEPTGIQTIKVNKQKVDTQHNRLSRTITGIFCKIRKKQNRGGQNNAANCTRTLQRKIL